jgi:molybdate transport system ATP-binding protein
MTPFSLHITDVSFNDHQIEPFNFGFHSGQNWLISDHSGDFISNFFDWFESKRFFGNGSLELINGIDRIIGHFSVLKFIEIVRFKHLTESNKDGYYQQRYHATENEDIITLRQFFNIENDQQLISGFGLSALLDEKVNMLSTGELRKAYIAKALLKKPLFLFIEEPFAGIDQQGRELIDHLLSHISGNGINVVIASNAEFIPSSITHVLQYTDHRILYLGLKNDHRTQKLLVAQNDKIRYPGCPALQFEHAFKLVNVGVKYDEKVILKNINWEVGKGEKWALKGKNGAGKSMLLSLVYADHPQVYSNEIWVFDKLRGTGENIWDIKDNIGFFSSEFYLYFDKSRTVDEAIRYIVSQNPYKKRVVTEDELQFKNNLLEQLKLSKFNSTRLYELSAVNQRLILLCAVLMKNTPLVILDEPFQGFDNYLIHNMIQIIEEYTQHRTLVFVSHNDEEFPKCITKRFVIENGYGRDI